MNITKQCCEIYHKNLNQETIDYVLSRGISQDNIDKFELGYAGQKTAYPILSSQYTDEELKNSGLFSDTNGMHDIFRNRLVIPIKQGDHIEMLTSRALPSSNSKKPHMHQSGAKIEYAFNFDNLLKYNTIVIVEGPFDSMSLEEWSIPSMGLLGVHRMTHTIIRQLTDKRVYICFDSEPNKTGEKASYKIARKLMEYLIPSNIIHLPDNGEKLDVNKFFLTHKKKDFIDLIRAAEPYNKPTERRPKTTKVHTNLDIIAVASHYLELKMYGGRYKTICPFHKDSEPSMVFYPETQSAYCFGCGMYGNSISLIRQCEALRGNKITDKEAIEIGKTL